MEWVDAYFGDAVREIPHKEPHHDLTLVEHQPAEHDFWRVDWKDAFRSVDRADALWRSASHLNFSKQLHIHERCMKLDTSSRSIVIFGPTQNTTLHVLLLTYDLVPRCALEFQFELQSTNFPYNKCVHILGSLLFIHAKQTVFVYTDMGLMLYSIDLPLPQTRIHVASDDLRHFFLTVGRDCVREIVWDREKNSFCQLPHSFGWGKHAGNIIDVVQVGACSTHMCALYVTLQEVWLACWSRSTQELLWSVKCGLFSASRELFFPTASFVFLQGCVILASNQAYGPSSWDLWTGERQTGRPNGHCNSSSQNFHLVMPHSEWLQLQRQPDVRTISEPTKLYRVLLLASAVYQPHLEVATLELNTMNFLETDTKLPKISHIRRSAFSAVTVDELFFYVTWNRIILMDAKANRTLFEVPTPSPMIKYNIVPQVCMSPDKTQLITLDPEGLITICEPAFGYVAPWKLYFAQ